MADYSRLKVAELKDILKERGIPTTGLSRKQSIIDALESHDAQEGKADAGRGGLDTVDEETGAAAAEAAAETAAELPEVAPEEAPEAADATAESAEGTDAIAQTIAAPGNTQPGSEDVPKRATPRGGSPAPDASSESRKRKRPSPTPDASDGSVQKKLRAAESEAKLSGDSVVEDAPVPMDASADTVAQPYSTSDGPTRDGPADATMTDEPLPSDHPAAPDASAVSLERPVDAQHPVTRALYIRDLIRPLQPQQLQDHLVALADSTDDIIESFHLDVLRTHAFALFKFATSALKVRQALHNTVFPDEPTRKPLSVDFVPEDRVLEWIETEQSSGTSRRDAKRWEVVYDDSYGDIRATLQEVSPTRARQQSFSRPAAPSAPVPSRDHRPSETPLAPEIQPELPDEPATLAAKQTPAIESSAASFDLLDSQFQFTTTKPKLYYLPKDAELADKRLDEIQRETSRDWEGGTERDFAEGGPGGELRRYTFEDGDRLVDGGMDRGSFGVPGGDRGRRRGGFGGGGYRGGRGWRR